MVHVQCICVLSCWQFVGHGYKGQVFLALINLKCYTGNTVTVGIRVGKLCVRPVAHTARVYLGFCCMKQLGVFVLLDEI